MRKISLSKDVVLRWLLLVAVVFAVCLPTAAHKCWAGSNLYRVSVDKGYLALRTAKAYDESNEIGELYTGDTVDVRDYSDSTYWYVYSPKYGKYGYVNKNYLIDECSSTYHYSGRYFYDSSAGNCTHSCVTISTWTVRVNKGYLALRTAKAYDESNEIGELYTGDMVEVRDSADSTYWYVYSPKHGKYGYVNKDYLVYNGSYTTIMTW